MERRAGEGRRGGTQRRLRPALSLTPPFPSPPPLPCSFLVSAHFTNYDFGHFMVNLAVVVVLVAAKLPELHGVRILGINSARLEEREE